MKHSGKARKAAFKLILISLIVLARGLGAGRFYRGGGRHYRGGRRGDYARC